MNIAQLLNGLALGALYVVLSSGLAMIYGLRGVMNFAHGAIYMFGAYVSYEVASTAGFWPALIIAPLVLAVLGAALELGVFRPLLSRSPIELALITFGFAMIIQRLVVVIWGERPLSVDPPSGFEGTVGLLGVTYPAYRLLLIAAALAIALGLVFWLRGSRTGLHVRASSQEPETTAVLGVNVDRLSLVVVSMGAGLAGVAGALASAYLPVQPGMDMQILISVLIVVVVGGLGSIGGAMIAALVLGMLEVIGTVYLPSVAFLIPYVALILVLLWRPTGIAGKRVE